jgi:hypothetical protein
MLLQQKPLQSSKKDIQNSYQIYELLIPYKSQSTIVCIPSTEINFTPGSRDKVCLLPAEVSGDVGTWDSGHVKYLKLVT